MNRAAKSSKTAPSKSEAAARLTRDDWLDAAFDAVAEGGFDKARVLTLADTLGVTRGSFYWHFADHAELIAALLQRWRDREEAEQRAIEAQSASTPEADLDNMLDAALAHAGDDLKNMRFELALRGMGRREPAVAQMLLEVDEMRLALFQKKFRRLVHSTKAAGELATLFYLAIVGGHQALSRPTSPPAMKQVIKNLISDYLIHRQIKPAKD